ncbi:MAG TPA: hypothetical protein VFM63_10825 [Pyrinomonadaceae bacterium]|nr:hypothetical protein [Pyrinomonadaceae bacterium]
MGQRPNEGHSPKSINALTARHSLASHQGGKAASRHQGGKAASRHQGGKVASRHQGGKAASRHQGGRAAENDSLCNPFCYLTSTIEIESALPRTGFIATSQNPDCGTFGRGAVVYGP